MFVPLASLFRAMAWRYAALVIAMVIFGAWHGARWTFVAWGARHGLLPVGHRFALQLSPRLRIDERATPVRLLSSLTTFALIAALTGLSERAAVAPFTYAMF